MRDKSLIWNTREGIQTSESRCFKHNSQKIQTGARNGSHDRRNMTLARRSERTTKRSEQQKDVANRKKPSYLNLGKHTQAFTNVEKVEFEHVCHCRMSTRAHDSP